MCGFLSTKVLLGSHICYAVCCTSLECDTPNAFFASYPFRVMVKAHHPSAFQTFMPIAAKHMEASKGV